MKAMILSDMLTAKKYLVQQLVVALLVGGFVCIVMENLYAVSYTHLDVYKRQACPPPA